MYLHKDTQQEAATLICKTDLQVHELGACCGTTHCGFSWQWRPLSLSRNETQQQLIGR